MLPAGCAELDESLGPDAMAELDLKVSAYPEEIRRGYGLFMKRCSECHSIGKPMAARIQEGRWRLIARRMARKAGSGIAEDEIAPIAAFLEHHLNRKQIP